MLDPLIAMTSDAEEGQAERQRANEQPLSRVSGMVLELMAITAMCVNLILASPRRPGVK